jgi:hypothetical protein
MWVYAVSLTFVRIPIDRVFLLQYNLLEVTLCEEPDYERNPIPSICRRIWFTAHNGPRSKRTQWALRHLHVSVFPASMVSHLLVCLISVIYESDVRKGLIYLFSWAKSRQQISRYVMSFGQPTGISVPVVWPYRRYRVQAEYAQRACESRLYRYVECQ